MSWFFTTSNTNSMSAVQVMLSALKNILQAPAKKLSWWYDI